MEQLATDLSLWGLFAHASPIVQGIMLFLVGLSIFSWALILQQAAVLRRARRECEAFEYRFVPGADLAKLYEELAGQKRQRSVPENLFFQGFHAFARLHKQVPERPEAVVESAERAMQVVLSSHHEGLQRWTVGLATIASVSPYIGLLGTVWGIMHAFMALSGLQQATLSMVAPGIAEALVATAMGLFTAIPALIAYNRFSHRAMAVRERWENFGEDFAGLLHRKAHMHAVVE